MSITGLRLALAAATLLIAPATLAQAQAPATAQTPAPAQAWPQRSVKFILPLGPGSGADIGARMLAEKLTAKWSQPVVIENRPGGDGIVAITAFTSAKDDHQLLFTPTSTFTAHPYLHDKLPYDIRDLNPIARVSNTIVAVGVPAASSIQSMSDLMAEAKAQPGKLNWATITGLFDFVFSGYLKKANLDIARVPYRNPVDAANDLGENRIQLILSAYAIIRPQVQAGKVRIIAITARERAEAIKDIPTTTEAGYPDLMIEGLAGLFGPRDMPADLRERIAADVREALSDPAIAKRLEATGQVVNPGTAAEFGQALEQQRAQAASVGQVLGLKAAQ